MFPLLSILPRSCCFDVYSVFFFELAVVVVSEPVGVVIHGVDGSPSPEDQMMYAIILRVCRRYTTSWEYESTWSRVPWLGRAIITRVKTPQSQPFVCRGELLGCSEQLQSRLHSLSVI